MIARLRAFAHGKLSSLAALYRREPAIALLFTAAAIATLLPVWIARYLPLLDYPNHLSNVFVWRHLHDPQWNFEPYYATNLAPMPYYAQYALVYALSLPFGVEIGQKIFVSLVLLLLPLSLALFARRVGRDPRLALLAFPLGWNVNLAMGFLSYVGGLPLLFFALTALDHHAERPSWKWGTLAALLGASLYFFHILPWGMFMAIGGATALLAPRPWKWWRALLAPLPTLPALAVGVLCYRSFRGSTGTVNPWNPQGISGYEGVYNDVGGNLAFIPGWLMDIFPGGRDEAFAFALAIVWLLLIAARPLDPEPATAVPSDADPRSYRLELAGLVALLLFLLLPRSLLKPFYWYAVNRRLAIVVALFALLLVRGRLGRARTLLLALAGTIAVAFPLDIAAHFHRFNRRARGFDDVMAVVPRGAQVLPLMLNLGDPEVNVNCFNQWGTYIQMRQGGYLQFNFPLEFPLKFLKRIPSPPWDHPEAFHFAYHSEGWDYFLLHGPYGNDPFVGNRDKVRLLKKSGDWEVWEKKPRPPAKIEK